MSYQHLGLVERYYIATALKMKVSINKIAKDISRSQSTITREIQRNTGQRGYRHKQAQHFAEERQAKKPKAIKLTKEIKYLITACLKREWSPEQIAGRLSDDGFISLHHETIYQFVLADKAAGGQLYKYLRHQNKTYRKRYGSAHNRSGIPNRVDIDERPAEANDRIRVGDWEADTIIGKNHKGAIVTLDDRKSKLRLAAPLPAKKAIYVKTAIVSLLFPVKEFVKTMTFDNGKEFTLHEKIATELDCATYFAKPYHSWERGQNENANGLLRQYFPKTMELVDVTLKQVLEAVDRLNNRPRKCLDFKTPYEAFENLTGVDVKKITGYALIT
jgi:IS30 family transposase